MDLDQLIDMTPLRPQRRPTEERDHSLVVDLDRGAVPVPSPRREDYSYIWGTGIAVEVFKEEFRRYLETFELQMVTAASPPVMESAMDLTSRLGSMLTSGGSNAALHSSSHGLRESTGSGAAVNARDRYYIKELMRIHLQGRRTFELDFSWLQRVAPALYLQTLNHPTECLQMMNAVAEELYRDVLRHRHGMSLAEDLVLHVAPKRLPRTVTLQQLSPEHMEQLVSIRGMVIRVSKIIPEIRVASFQCWSCQSVERSISGDKGRIIEPTRCAHCGKTYSFRLQHNASVYEDKQLIKVQESPEHVADGETPVSISVVVYGGMVDGVVPGDRIVVTGIFRSVPIRLNANTRIIKSIFMTHIDAVHVELVRASRIVDVKGGATSTAENSHLGTALPTATGVDGGEQSKKLSRADVMDAGRLDMFHRLAHRPDIYQILLQSLAPAIWGHEDVKRGILAQLFGGTPKTFVFDRQTPGSNSGDDDGADVAGPSVSATSSHASPSHGNRAFFRSALNVILCGDPGVAKSQLLTQVHQIAPRGIYTSGKGSSSVGLTAFVVQDHDTGETVLEPGALVLSDQGLCCIDEFDKMNEATRSVLHEVMEQQTLSVAKAGIIAQLNARTSILAAANPKESQWNPHLNVVENLQIEPTLLSRFDLIFLLLDHRDPAEDRRLASHVLSLYMDTSEGTRSAAGGLADSTDSDAEADGSFAVRTDGGRRTRHGVHTAAGGGDATAIDPITGLAVDIHMQYEGETFLQGPMAAPYMPTAILSEYIAIARDTVFPKLTEASHKHLASSYVQLRRSRGSRTVSATLRQLESMIRLAEARAKMRFATEVSVEDVQEAKRLISAALKEAATDPRTGLVNLDIFHAPDPTKNTVEGNMLRLQELIERRYTSQNRTQAPVAELRAAFHEQMPSGLRQVAPAQFMELLALMSGGESVHSFTATTVVFATSAGGGGGAN